MKRMIITAVSVLAATAAFAAPASATTADTSAEMVAPCRDGESVVACAQRLAGSSIALKVCYAGEPIDTCVIRIARTVPDVLFDYAEWAAYTAGYYAGYAIDQAEAACERYLSGCAAVPLP